MFLILDENRFIFSTDQPQNTVAKCYESGSNLDIASSICIEFTRYVTNVKLGLNLDHTIKF